MSTFDKKKKKKNVKVKVLRQWIFTRKRIIMEKCPYFIINIEYLIFVVFPINQNILLVQKASKFNTSFLKRSL